jgi:hypothetical protein
MNAHRGVKMETKRSKDQTQEGMYKFRISVEGLGRIPIEQ